MNPPMRNYEGILVDENDWRSRIAVLETKHEHMSEKINQMAGKVDDLHSIMTEAKGLKRAALFALPVASGIVGAKFTAIASFLGFK